MAIAYDNSASNSGTSTSLTVTFTIASGASLFVFTGNETASLPSSVTWNTSEALSQVGSTGYFENGWYYLANPTPGSHDVVVTMGSSAAFIVDAISLTGMASSSAIGNNAVADWGGSGANHGLCVITTGTDNSFVLSGLYVGTASGTSTATGTNQTQRLSTTAGILIASSTQTTTTAGSYTASYNFTNTSNWGINTIEVKPPGAAVASSRNINLALLGVT